MPRRRRHLDDQLKQQPKRSSASWHKSSIQHLEAGKIMPEGLSEGLVNSAALLGGDQLHQSQRQALAGQIGQVQGNRKLQGMMVALKRDTTVAPFDLGLPAPTGLTIQRQEEPPVTHPKIRYGSRGPAVSEAQGKLNNVGATPPLAVDSIFGPLTRAAVIEFQNGNQLSPDGIIGPLTWGKLDAAQGGGELPNISELRWNPEDQIRLAGQTYSSGPLNGYQSLRAEARINMISDTEYDYFRSLLDMAGSDMEWAFLCKALAAQRSMDDIALFADRIRGMSERWLMRNLMVVNLETRMDPDSTDPEERGIMQQYGNSCGPTSVQLIHAQADPIYALELRSTGPIDQAPDQAVTNPDTVMNPTLAGEQAGILNAHNQAGTGNAPTNRTNPTGGAWVESDMNALANATGVTYTTQIIGAGITMDNAITSLYSGLNSGVHVPIVVGGGTGAANTSHYVVVLLVNGSRFLVHDVATGESVWRTEAQFRGNTLNLPSGWNFFVAIDVPTLVPPPLPEPPGPSGG